MLEDGTKNKKVLGPRKLLTPVLLSTTFIFFWLPFVVVEILKTFGIFPEIVSLKIKTFEALSFNV